MLEINFLSISIRGEKVQGNVDVRLYTLSKERWIAKGRPWKNVCWVVLAARSATLTGRANLLSYQTWVKALWLILPLKLDSLCNLPVYTPPLDFSPFFFSSHMKVSVSFIPIIAVKQHFTFSEFPLRSKKRKKKN